MQVGMTKDQGLYNKPSAAVHPGALSAGTLPQYNTIHLYLHIPRKELRCHTLNVLYVGLIFLETVPSKHGTPAPVCVIPDQ